MNIIYADLDKTQHKEKMSIEHNCTHAPVSNFQMKYLTPHALTPGDPTWNPCTVMRTVSPTFALVGDIKSLGPFGAAEKRKKRKKDTKRQRSLY